MLAALLLTLAPGALAQAAQPNAPTEAQAPVAPETLRPVAGVENGGESLRLGGIDLGENADLLEILLMLTVLALLPSILIMTTSFTRIAIVLSCLRNAIGLQQTPPNQVLVGMALFLSLFIMQPALTEIHEQAYKPYERGELTQLQAVEKAAQPLRAFMLRNTNAQDLNMFLELGGRERPETLDDIDILTVVPAFITSELKRAFLIGFMLYLPFLVIDMVVASTLMSLGMVMLPPALISLPFKLMLFVLVDGWSLAIKSLVMGFH
ncbi:MAG: flagellar type III secretion system pore protein FliP [Christensenellaceae bacterium]|nr:flagellar type III secretion system pore protein FliP [Christensenellaceae bacterium]MEA5064527.1 flagellar type III secretion system pore protein FliP [Eubacteriales bacterium]MEA5068629.1 flagellar type III secretion system pore protein FliP [Christensenellaceae bacterium]